MIDGSTYLSCIHTSLHIEAYDHTVCGWIGLEEVTQTLCMCVLAVEEAGIISALTGTELRFSSWMATVEEASCRPFTLRSGKKNIHILHHTDMQQRSNVTVHVHMTLCIPYHARIVTCLPAVPVLLYNRLQ